MIDFRYRIEVDAKLLLHEAGGGLFECHDAVIRVTPVFQLVDLALEDVPDERIGHVIILADAEIEQPSLGMSGQGSALGPLDFLALIDFVALAVAAAADPLVAKRLKPWI